MLITSNFISYQSYSVAIFIIRYLNTIISICRYIIHILYLPVEMTLVIIICQESGKYSV